MRRADKGGECPICGRCIEPGEPIRNTRVGDLRRWVHPECAPSPVPYAPANVSTAPEPVIVPTPADAQRNALAWARSRLNEMRAAGWTGDDADELSRLRAARECQIEANGG